MTTIRLALPSDVEEIARVHVRAWQIALRGHVPDAYLDALRVADRIELWSRAVAADDMSVFVALEASSVVGFALLMPSRDEDAAEGAGELAALYVDPDHWRSGIGSALVGAVVDAARARAFRVLTLWALSTNAPARAFYEARAFVADGHEKTDERRGLSLHEVRYVLGLDSTDAAPTSGAPAQ